MLPTNMEQVLWVWCNATKDFLKDIRPQLDADGKAKLDKWLEGYALLYQSAALPTDPKKSA